MGLEKTLAEYITEAKFEDLPGDPIATTRNVVLTIMGTTIAGARTEGCQEVVQQVREWGGKEESSILIHSGKVPACNAALANSFMARALDFCDGMSPGIHIGASSVPTGLAVAELVGGCSGKDFLTALVVGSELAARLNLSESAYNGFDPTGVCTVFATAAIAGKILELNSKQMLNALALVFNRSGGSFQSNIDGSLAVRLIQGFVSQSGIMCAQLAGRGITGPKDFLEGVYGYFHLFSGDEYDSQSILADLGTKFRMTNLLFKKYPSCGSTLASTDAILQVVEENNLVAEDIDQIMISVTPYTYNLVGSPFKIGENPKVDAQFNIQYCVANAILRRLPELRHFDEAYVRDPNVVDLIKKISVVSDTKLMERGNRTAALRVVTKEGRNYQAIVDRPRGFPDNPLIQEEHDKRFRDCMEYAGWSISDDRAEKILSSVRHLELLEDVRTLINVLT